MASGTVGSDALPQQGQSISNKPDAIMRAQQLRITHKLTALICSVALAGCAVVESQVVTGSTPVPGGIPYFLPRRPFIITVSMPVSGNLPIITVTSGSAEPDLTKRFVLSQGTNWFADNEFNITVGSNGLLKSSASTATSQVATVVQNAATTVGMFATPLAGSAVFTKLLSPSVANRVGLNAPSTTMIAPPGPSIACPLAGGSYQYPVYPEKLYSTAQPLRFCEDTPTPYTVSWHRADEKTGPYGADNENSKDDANNNEVSGIFFRHELPYIVSILGAPVPPKNLITESDYIVMSPDESETNFFPVKRSFFANNTADLLVTDGVLTGVDQTTKSEIAASVGLPATFISSYTAAVGQLLSGLTTNSGDQQKLLQQLQATAVTQKQASVVAAAQYQLCMKTAGSYNWGSLNPADAATALTALKAACPGS